MTAQRGDARRQWIQVVTDTADNRENNVVDALYEIVDGERRELDAADPSQLLMDTPAVRGRAG